jgi:hypothetical protein
VSQSLRNSADKLAGEMAKAVNLDTLTGGLEVVVNTNPDMLVMALSTMDATTTKNMIVLAMTMIIVAKLEQSLNESST